MVLIVVFTFSAGGAAAVGALTVVRVLPGGLVAPLVSARAATSPSPQRHLAFGIGVRMLTMVVVMVVVHSGATVGVFLAIVGIDSVLSSVVRPLQSALVVRLAETAAEAAAGNATTTSLLNLSALAGPALGGLALESVGIDWAFVAPGIVFAAGTAAA